MFDGENEGSDCTDIAIGALLQFCTVSAPPMTGCALPSMRKPYVALLMVEFAIVGLQLVIQIAPGSTMYGLPPA